MNDGPARVGFGAFLALAVLPIAAGLLYAALYSCGLAGLLHEGFTLKPWRSVLTSRDLWSSIGLSLYIAFAVAGLTLAISLTLAVGLQARLRRGPLGYLLYLPLALPWTVAGFVTQQVLARSGLASRMLTALGVIRGIEGFPALVQDPLAVGIIVAHVGLAVPFFTLFLAQLHESERVDDLCALAMSLGASRSQAVWRVTLPLLLRGSVGNLFLLLVVVFGAYEIPLLLGRQSPETISVLAIRKFTAYDLAQKPEAFVVALVYTAAMTLALTLFVRAGWGRRVA